MTTAVLAYKKLDIFSFRGDKMYSNEKRKSSGPLQPNLYLLLQTLVLFLLLSLVVQLTELYNLGVFVLLISGFISIGVMFYFLLQRKRVIRRQIPRSSY